MTNINELRQRLALNLKRIPPSRMSLKGEEGKPTDLQKVVGRRRKRTDKKYRKRHLADTKVMKPVRGYDTGFSPWAESANALPEDAMFMSEDTLEKYSYAKLRHRLARIYES